MALLAAQRQWFARAGGTFLKRSAVTRCCPQQKPRAPLHSWGHVLQPACLLSLSLISKCTIYSCWVRAPLLKHEQCSELLPLLWNSQGSGWLLLLSDALSPQCSGSCEGISKNLALNSQRLCRKLESGASVSGTQKQRVNQMYFIFTSTGISVMTK